MVEETRIRLSLFGIAKGTILCTIAGPKNVESIGIDDFVLSPDDTYRRVNNIFESDHKTLIEIKTSESTIKLSKKCPVLVKAMYRTCDGPGYFPVRWMMPSEMREGDLVFYAKDRKWSSILSISESSSPNTVALFSLQLKNYDAYIANDIAVGASNRDGLSAL